MKPYQHITQMEEILNSQTEKLAQLNELLEYFNQNAEQYQALVDYYYSDQREQDLADDAAHHIPEDLNRGVLSEDGIWNLMEDHYGTAVHMMEIGLAMIKAR